jgi:two-component system LytT family response regulator
MRVLIVDDERLARVELRRLLGEHADVEIAGEATNIQEAKSAIAELQPELLLLDIQMPGGTGFDLLNDLDFAPKVIFTTGFDEFALQAFEVNALDYLMKPIAADRLAAALQKARTQSTAGTPKLGAQQQIFIKDGERCWFVKVNDIILLESEGNYTRVFFGANRPLINRSLRALEERLDPALFFRSSRKHLVNLQAVEKVEPAIGGGFVLQVKGGMEIEMSRRRAIDFRIQMSL